ncbi:RCC1/BLIP-II [Roridomyces roridus]|uniref:RCC1/BLIP-II n=1 Tax=Roridomyces roridus TaxID=1738132 RepID=A0AAD7BZL9_9AGAR|nr:RCC1/BLIP-II [Roridomyces roridus]
MAKNSTPTQRTTRKRKGADEPPARAGKRARLPVPVPPPLNAIPQPSQADEKRILLVHGGFDAGQLGLGDDQEKEVMRPRVHPLFLEWVTSGDVGPTGLEQVAAGGMHSLILDSNGKVWSFGSNDSFALGRVTEPPEGKPDNLPELVTGLEDFRATFIAASDNLSIAISNEGKLRAWGTFKSDGLLGFMGRKDIVMTPTALPALNKKLICAAVCGENHALALSCDGIVYSWGDGSQYQLGRRILARRKENGLTPEALHLRSITGIFTGTHTSFAINRNGVVFAWGLNQMRQTGVDDDALHITTPTEVDALHPSAHGGARVVEIAGGEHHTHFLFDNGEFWACGRAGADRLGIAADHPLVTAHEALVVATEQRLAAYVAEHGELAKLPDELLPANRPKRGDFLVPTPIRVAFPPPPTPNNPDPALPPYPIFSNTRIAHITASERYSLAVDDSGRLYSWGEGNASQLGLGNVSNASTPTRVANTALKAHRVVAASAGGQHVLLLGVKHS